MSRTMTEDAKAHDCQCLTCTHTRREGIYASDLEAPEADALPPLRLVEDSAARKRMPMAAGLLDYFPDALAAVSEVSFVGNQKHNPGQPVHWTRGKSNDHADCIMRHLVDRGSYGSDGIRHSAALAWRALALLQEELEAERGLPVSRGSQG